MEVTRRATSCGLGYLEVGLDWLLGFFEAVKLWALSQAVGCGQSYFWNAYGSSIVGGQQCFGSSCAISKSLFCINRVKNFVDEFSLRKLYFSMVHSHLSYGINVYGCATSTALEKLRIMQKKAIRVISNANYRAHTAPLFRELKSCL